MSTTTDILIRCLSFLSPISFQIPHFHFIKKRQLGAEKDN
jgi:hypothetical protein